MTDTMPRMMPAPEVNSPLFGLSIERITLGTPAPPSPSDDIDDVLDSLGIPRGTTPRPPRRRGGGVQALSRSVRFEVNKAASAPIPAPPPPPPSSRRLDAAFSRHGPPPSTSSSATPPPPTPPPRGRGRGGGTPPHASALGFRSGAASTGTDYSFEFGADPSSSSPPNKASSAAALLPPPTSLLSSRPPPTTNRSAPQPTQPTRGKAGVRFGTAERSGSAGRRARGLLAPSASSAAADDDDEGKGGGGARTPVESRSRELPKKGASGAAVATALQSRAGASPFSFRETPPGAPPPPSALGKENISAAPPRRSGPDNIPAPAGMVLRGNEASAKKGGGGKIGVPGIAPPPGGVVVVRKRSPLSDFPAPSSGGNDKGLVRLQPAVKRLKVGTVPKTPGGGGRKKGLEGGEEGGANMKTRAKKKATEAKGRAKKTGAAPKGGRRKVSGSNFAPLSHAVKPLAGRLLPLGWQAKYSEANKKEYYVHPKRAPGGVPELPEDVVGLMREEAEASAKKGKRPAAGRGEKGESGGSGETGEDGDGEEEQEEEEDTSSEEEEFVHPLLGTLVSVQYRTPKASFRYSARHRGSPGGEGGDMMDEDGDDDDDDDDDDISELSDYLGTPAKLPEQQEGENDERDEGGGAMEGGDNADDEPDARAAAETPVVKSGAPSKRREGRLLKEAENARDKKKKMAEKAEEEERRRSTALDDAGDGEDNEDRQHHEQQQAESDDADFDFGDNDDFGPGASPSSSAKNPVRDVPESAIAAKAAKRKSVHFQSDRDEGAGDKSPPRSQRASSAVSSGTDSEQSVDMLEVWGVHRQQVATEAEVAQFFKAAIGRYAPSPFEGGGGGEGEEEEEDDDDDDDDFDHDEQGGAFAKGRKRRKTKERKKKQPPPKLTLVHPLINRVFEGVQGDALKAARDRRALEVKKKKRELRMQNDEEAAQESDADED